MKNFSWTFIGNATFAFSQWFIVFLITKYADVDFLGKFSYVQALTAPVFMLLSFSLRTVVSSDISKKINEKEYFSFRFYCSLLAVLISISIAFLSKKEDYIIIVLAITFGFAKFIDAISDLAYGFYQQNYKFKSVGLSFCLRGILNCIFSYIAIRYINELWFSISFLLSWIIVLLFIDYPQLSQAFSFRFNKSQFFKILIATLPLGINLFIISLSTNIQRYLVESLLGYKMLGLMSGILYFNTVGILFVSSLSQSSVPDLSKYFHLNDFTSFWKLLVRLSLIVLSISIIYLIVTVIGGDMILKLFYNEEFVQYSKLFIIAALISIPGYLGSILGYALTAIGEYKVQIYATIINIVVNVLAGYWMIKIYRVDGAMYSMLIATCLQTLTLSILLKKKITKSLYKKTNNG